MISKEKVMPPLCLAEIQKLILEFECQQPKKEKTPCGWCAGTGKSPHNPEEFCSWCGGLMWF